MFWLDTMVDTVTQKIVAMFDTFDMYGYSTGNKIGKNGLFLGFNMIYF